MLGDNWFCQSGHVITFAHTGSGKGTGLVIPTLLEYPGSVFVFDVKGENYAVTAGARRALGQAVFLLDPSGVTGDPSHGLNWLDRIDLDSEDLDDMLAVMMVSEAAFGVVARAANRGKSSGVSQQFHGRELLTPDEVMRKRRAIVFVASEPAWLLDRIDYRHHPEYRGSFDANPYHTHPARP